MTTRLLLILLLLPALAAAQAPSKYPVTGRVGRLQAPASMYLVYGREVLDSASLYDGRFVLHGSRGWPRTARLVLERQGRLRRTADGYGCLSPEQVGVFLSEEPVRVVSADSLLKARVTGGPQLAAYQQLQANSKPFWYDPKLTPAENAVRKTQLSQAYRSFIKAHPTDWVSMEALMGMQLEQEPQDAEILPLYEAFTPAMKASVPGRLLSDRFEFVAARKATAVGAEAPDFTSRTPEGKSISLRDYRGRYVLVDFWASWCRPCRQEFPQLRQLYAQFKDRNFAVLGVSIDNERTLAQWIKAIADDQLPWPQVSDLRGDQGDARRRYGVKEIPQNFLLDPAGRILAVDLSGDELAAQLARLLP